MDPIQTIESGDPLVQMLAGAFGVLWVMDKAVFYYRTFKLNRRNHSSNPEMSLSDSMIRHQREILNTLKSIGRGIEKNGDKMAADSEQNRMELRSIRETSARIETKLDRSFE